MLTKIIDKMKYYITLAIKKPYLIRSYIYKKHLGVIISIPIYKKDVSLNNKHLTIKNSTNLKEINNFYKRMNRDSINPTEIGKWLNRDYDCFLVKYEDRIIGSMWIFKNKFNLNRSEERRVGKE